MSLLKIKSIQFLLSTLMLVIVLSACTNNASNKDSAGNTDTTAIAPPATDATDANQQKLEANKKLVADFIQSLYGDRDSTAIDKYVADSIIQHDPALQDGKAWLKYTLGFFLRNPNAEKAKIDITQMAAEGDKVWTLERDFAANGRAMSARVEIFRIENGKIAERWLVMQYIPKKSANKNSMF